MDYEFKFKDDCPYKGACKDEEDKGCSSLCARYCELDYLLNTSNIPKTMRKQNKLRPMNDKDKETFVQLASIKSDINNFVYNGNNLYIWGNNTGSGKSFWASKLLKAYIGSVHIGNQFTDRCMFIYVPTLLVKIKDFTDNNARIELIRKVSTLDLVVMDDIGSVSTSKYDLTILSSIIDYRYSNGLSTIYTSNLAPDDLDATVDVRIADRVLSGYCMEITAGSMRGKGGVYNK